MVIGLIGYYSSLPTQLRVAWIKDSRWHTVAQTTLNNESLGPSRSRVAQAGKNERPSRNADRMGFRPSVQAVQAKTSNFFLSCGIACSLLIKEYLIFAWTAWTAWTEVDFIGISLRPSKK
jgi:hypothetical protein